MKIVLAPDSFKESMTAKTAAEAMAEGVRQVFPQANCLVLPLSDGGEGFTQSLANALDGTMMDSEVTGHDGQPHSATWCYVAHSRTAILEVAEVIGLEKTPVNQRNIMTASSYPLGQLIKVALDHGAGKLLIGLGGSASNDLGLGMLHALGARFMDAHGQELAIAPIPTNLPLIHGIDFSGLDPRLKQTEIQVACDVDNPLLGENGCARIFAPQKGAEAADIEHLERLALQIVQITGTEHQATVPGVGAAGGLGWAFHAILQAPLIAGIDLVIDTIRLADLVLGADLVFTGEGSLDGQTLSGKTPFGVAQVARQQNIPCVAFAGRIDDQNPELKELFTAVIPINRQVTSLEQALTNGEENLKAAAELVTRLWYRQGPHSK